MLRDELKNILGGKEYTKIQLKTAETLIRKARFSSDVKEIVSCLLALQAIIDDCLEALEGVEWEKKLQLK